MARLPKNVLVLGSGGREHALARALLRGSPDRTVVVAPGNGGIEGERLRRTDVDLTDLGAVVDLARRERADLVVVGPEAPLCAGVADALESAGIPVFGPSKAAAKLEGSKAFLKEFAQRHGIPTAPFCVVRSFEEADANITRRGAPIVVKADGLCAGKGVVVAKSVEEARAAASSMLRDRAFGEAGSVVVLEDEIVGREVSVHAICDGARWALLPPARDHKRVFDGDRGPNTGGMGVVCPASDVDAALIATIEKEIVAPTLEGMRRDGTPFRGVLFAGVMIDAAGRPQLLEHNTRFGDPECEAMMELVEGDLGRVLADAAAGALDPSSLKIAHGRHAAVVVLASAGYPERPRTGDTIRGVAEAEAGGAVVHHAGTKRGADGALATSGGRVLAVTGSGADLESALRVAYAACERIAFDGKHFRTDIGRTVAKASGSIEP